ncbi:pyridoxal kinase PdxY [Methylobrevis pamukkalensis]|nr:pyridoxal kinase PdxY [Methylobrevis pamukkalensis]
MTEQGTPAAAEAGEILVISSHVVRGAVGGRAGFAFERLGRPVWFLPTVTLAYHPGHGRSTRILPPADAFAAMAADLAAAPWLPRIAAVVSGYLGEAGQAEAVAGLVRAVKAANPAALYLCDPVIGDHGGLYVPEATARAVRDTLLPLADIATPNLTELAWLTGTAVNDATSAALAARALGPARVAVTSVPGMMRGKIGTLLVTETAAIIAENPLVDTRIHGTGDLFANLLLDRLLAGASDETALAGAVAATFEVLARSAREGADELRLGAHQASLVRPMALVDVRRLAVGRAARSS